MEKKLLDVLDRLLVLNRELQGIFKEERVCLLENNMEGLRNINSRQMALGSELADCDKYRQKLVAELKVHFHIQAKEVSLREVIAAVGEPFGTLYAQRAEALRQVLIEVVRLRNLNNQLLQRMMAFNERNIRLFMTLGRKNLTYSQKGAIQQANKSILNSIV